MLRDGTLCQTCCSLYQCLNRADVFANMVHAWTEYSTFDFYHVLIAVQCGVDANGVFVHQLELAHVKLADAENRILVASLAVNADSLCISITCKTASIAE